jgi:hypothetical protein
MLVLIRSSLLRELSGRPPGMATSIKGAVVMTAVVVTRSISYKVLRNELTPQAVPNPGDFT